MPGTIPPNKKAIKVAYKLLKTPKDLQVDNQKNPPERLVRMWFRDSSTAQ